MIRVAMMHLTVRRLAPHFTLLGMLAVNLSSGVTSPIASGLQHRVERSHESLYIFLKTPTIYSFQARPPHFNQTPGI